jgi:hypothetical protein
MVLKQNSTTNILTPLELNNLFSMVLRCLTRLTYSKESKSLVLPPHLPLQTLYCNLCPSVDLFPIVHVLSFGFIGCFLLNPIRL